MSKPSIKLLRIEETDPRVVEYEWERDGDNGRPSHWLHLASGYHNPLWGCGSHIIHEDTVEECLDQLKSVVKCDCDRCL